VEILRSRLLDAFPHGFTTRRGGVSRAPFDALNLGGRVGDDRAAVDENWRRLRAETDLEFARVLQVHGDRVVAAGAPGAPAVEADGVLATAPGVAACVSVADCVPVLVADPRSGAAAAAHAGWRGTLAAIAARAVEALTGATGARPSELLAAVGPSIGPCCYEVSPDLAERFREAFGGDVLRTGAAAPGAERVAGGPRLDLWLANRRALERAGVDAARIDVLGRCTACDRARFFSHRRDRGRTGRQVGFIAPRPTPLP
jgi:YfiH family protein